MEFLKKMRENREEKVKDMGWMRRAFITASRKDWENDHGRKG